ncbi:MAG TPA: inositol monophosphatase family protein [Gammaproteobacteria bacterium]|jgi:myo-inositol-1(or 4)-monophosphatase|nr:inositol monophosphatase family protein [Gammaproteobacteria bacterium]
MQPLLNIAIRAARRAGDVVVRYVDRVDTLNVRTKEHNDFVSEVDKQAEDEIIQIIRAAYPDHAILGEESGALAGRTDDYTWVIDPLDGTTNFLHGFPVFSVSIAVKFRGKLEHGVIYDPLRNELYTASRGGGAQLNNRRLRTTNLKTLEGALIGTGFPFRENQNLDLYLQMFAAVAKKTAGIRRAGSAALDLAYVAAGRMDGFWEMGLKEWDMAAGLLMIQEAGGSVGYFDGRPGIPEDGSILAGGQKVFKLLAEEFAPLLPAR